MEEQAKQQGGEVVSLNDENCTHLVVEENSIKSLPISRRHKLHVVMQEVSLYQNATLSICTIYY